METHVHVNDLDLPQNPLPRNEKPIYLTEVYNVQGEKGKKDSVEIIRQNNTLIEMTEEEFNQMLSEL